MVLCHATLMDKGRLVHNVSFAVPLQYCARLRARWLLSSNRPGRSVGEIRTLPRPFCGTAYQRHLILLVAAPLSIAGSAMYPRSPLLLPILHDKCSTSFFGRGRRSETALQHATGVSSPWSCRQ
ncbi:hypothetical protein IG631_05852 [Alternaria alternata]|nr:hypothetical protein IG631_05852 [Alternaria alternata]